MHTTTLSKYLGKYVELRLSCGSIIYGKLRPESESLVEVEDAYLCWGVDASKERDHGHSLSLSSEYLETLEEYFKEKKKKPSAKSPFDTVEIAPEHVTMVRDISNRVDELEKKLTH
jgi:hypothetical protein